MKWGDQGNRMTTHLENYLKVTHITILLIVVEEATSETHARQLINVAKKNKNIETGE